MARTSAVSKLRAKRLERHQRNERFKKDETVILDRLEIPGDLWNNLAGISDARGISVDELIRLHLRGIVRQHKIYDLEDTLTFGKYAGEVLETVIRADPEYVGWLIENASRFEMTQAGHRLYAELEIADQEEAHNNPWAEEHFMD